MQDNPIPGQTNDARDRRTEAAVLSRVLELHPTHLTGRELSLDLGGDTISAADESYERAIRDLVGAGLLRIDGESVVPTIAAVRSEEISR